MARVTVEDCILQVPNRFDLVVLAARRAKDIAAGAPLTVDRDNDKDAVVALREIADQTVELPELEEEVIQHFQRRQAMEEQPEANSSSSAQIEADAVSEEVEAELEEQSEALPTEMADDAPDGMSFAEENIDTDD